MVHWMTRGLRNSFLIRGTTEDLLELLSSHGLLTCECSTRGRVWDATHPHYYYPPCRDAGTPIQQSLRRLATHVF